MSLDDFVTNVLGQLSEYRTSEVAFDVYVDELGDISRTESYNIHNLKFTIKLLKAKK